MFRLNRINSLTAWNIKCLFQENASANIEFILDHKELIHFASRNKLASAFSMVWTQCHSLSIAFETTPFISFCIQLPSALFIKQRTMRSCTTKIQDQRQKSKTCSGEYHNEIVSSSLELENQPQSNRNLCCWPLHCDKHCHAATSL